MSFPISPIPRVGTKDTIVVPVIKAESEGNYVKVRRVATRSREKFELEYSNITYDEFNVLKTFFISNQGSSFTFTHPATSAEYTCVFTQNELEKEYINNKLVNTKISIEEV